MGKAKPKNDVEEQATPCVNAEYSHKQGQFLAFIYYYSKLNGCPPAEADMARYFKISAPSVHAMVLGLEKRGLISRVPGQSRSISVRLPRPELPDLD